MSTLTPELGAPVTRRAAVLPAARPSLGDRRQANDAYTQHCIPPGWLNRVPA